MTNDPDPDWLNELPEELRDALLGVQEAHNEIKVDLILNPEEWTEEERRELLERIRGHYADTIAVIQEWEGD